MVFEYRFGCILCSLYSINAHFDTNLLVERIIKILEKEARVIIKGPYVVLDVFIILISQNSGSH